MAPLKQQMYQHLRSAKKWLTKAEEAFDKEHDVRAELDLMLAQAELQHVKEVNRSRQWRYKYVLLRHGLACGLAIMLTVAVGGMYWWNNKPETVSAVPLVGQVNVPMETVAKAESSVTPSVIPTVESLPAQRVTDSSSVSVAVLPNKTATIPTVEPPPRQLEKSQQIEQPVVVSAGEMQKLVRAAGKSLRGQ